MRIAWAVLLALGVAHAGDPIAEHDKAHGRPELARIGTVGDRPPAESTLVVHVHADGALVVEGEETKLRGLSTMLGTLPAGDAVLLRADARLPWVVMGRILDTCAERNVRTVFHAVLPEAGDEEGAFSWPLVAAEPGKRCATVVLSQRGPPADPSGLFRAARAAGAEHVLLHAGLGVPLGQVLRSCDALRRAGVRTVDLPTLIPPPGAAEGWSDLKALARRYAGREANLSITFDDQQVAAGTAVGMPPVDRIRGGTAGFVLEAGGSVDASGGFAGAATTREQRPVVAKRTEVAVELGLRWLADHQDNDGKWDCDGFLSHDPDDDKCDGVGAAPYDVGVTGLAVLAFLGAGYTDRKAPENAYAETVRRGLGYLMASQGDDGAFGAAAPARAAYNHVIATLALCEAYWMTRNPRYKVPAQKGLDRIARARNPGMAWRYAPRGGDNDTSLTVWCVMALKAGKSANLEIDPNALAGARAWIDSVSGQDGRVGYAAPGSLPDRDAGAAARWPPARSQSMTAAGILVRVFLGEHPRRSELIERGVKLCVEQPPDWNPDTGTIDMTYWHWGTLALFQYGGRPWDVWSKAIREAIVKHQHADGSGSRTGSWDPLDPWGAEGGRVYSTAVMTMCLEVFYRYDRR